MPDYLYTARNLSGVDISGKLTANSPREAMDVLARQSLFPLKLEDAKKGHIELKLFQGRVPDALIAQTMRQLAELLESGVPVLTCFQVLIKQTTHPKLKEVLNDIHDRVSDGESIDNAFAAHPNVFNDLTISIIRAGTEGAFLEDSLKRTAGFIEVQGELQSKVLGAMAYPIILAVVGSVLISGLIIFFVPMFQTMFDQILAQGGTLPMPTRLLLATREFMLAYYPYVFGGAALVFVWIRIQMASRFGRRLMDRWKLKIPLVGKILLESAVARFCRVFGTLLENGVPILRSLDISANSTGNSLLSEAILKSAENVSSGESLSKPLAEIGIFPPQVMAMISIAEESNTLETVLINAADTIERSTTRKLDTLIRLLEPLMLLLMAGAVLFIILALLIPIMGMTQQLQV